MIEILGSGNLADGKSYVMISRSDWEELESFRVLFDFAKERDPDGYRESLKEVAKEIGEDFPGEFKHLIERNPWAAKYLKAFNGRRGRPQALTAPQKDFIARNDKMTGKELYELLRGVYGYTGALKTVQNELVKARKLNQEIEI